MNAEVKEWLTVTKRSRQWLAEQCGVSKTTVDGWLSADRPISEPSQKIIRRLMSVSPKVNPTLSMEMFLAAQAKAAAHGLTLEEWIATLIEREVQPPKSESSDSEGGGKGK